MARQYPGMIRCRKKKGSEEMLTKKKAAQGIHDYFLSRIVPRVDKSGEVCTNKAGEILYDEKPCTVSGLVRALGLSRREELDGIDDPKIRAMVDRALLRIEESAEEKLFQKDLFQGTKLFLATNFPRWQNAGTEAPEEADDRGIFALWGN